MSDTWAQLATLAIALVCFAVGERLDGSGFVAAFAGGLAFAFTSRRAGTRPDTQVSDAAGQLLELMVFAMFGGYAVILGWRDASWRVVLFAVAALLVVQLVAVLVSLIRRGVPLHERLFIGWFGPRGIGTLVLGLLMVERGEIEQAPLITQVVAVTVTLSLAVHSATTWAGSAGSRRVGRETVGTLGAELGPLVRSFLARPEERLSACLPLRDRW